MHVGRTLKIIGIACLAVAALGAVHDTAWAWSILRTTGSLPQSRPPLVLNVPEHVLLFFAGMGLLRRRSWTPRVVVAYGLWRIGQLLLPQLIWVLPQLFDNYLVARGLRPLLEFNVVTSLLWRGWTMLDALAFPLLLMGFMTMPPVLAALRGEGSDPAAPLRVGPLFGGMNLLVGFAGIGSALSVVAIALTQWLSPGAGPTLSGAMVLPVFRTSAVLGLLYLVSGYGLLRGASWARPIAILAAVAAIGTGTLYALGSLLTAFGAVLGLKSAPVGFGPGTPADFLFSALLGGLRTLTQSVYPALLLVFVLRGLRPGEWSATDAEEQAGPVASS